MKMRSRKKGLRRYPPKNLALVERGALTNRYVVGWFAIKPELVRVFGHNTAMAWEWITTPALALDNRRPIDLVASGRFKLVQDLLVRLEYGVYT
jgi:uncharacterized protein (DUF2384 family)